MTIERLTANTIRGLAMDAVQKANCGHPGAPMGMADIATVLWTRFLRYDPTDARWPDRDRVVLSNGHASMLLYSVLHLTGTSLSLQDLQNFRQWHSPTAGHPEYGEAPGIETTTGPLGQGLANGVGMALAHDWLRARFGADLVDHWVYVLAGDGCLMEGVAAEAASLAGHLGLGRLIVLYDDNRITIDGATDLSFSEDVTQRFLAQGWHVLECDGHDHEAIARAITAAKAETGRPSLIRCRTTIGFGSPNRQGKSKAHGEPLGPDEVKLAKQALGLDPEQSFVVPAEVVAHVRARDTERAQARQAWTARLENSPQAALWRQHHEAPRADSGVTFAPGTKLATRKASQKVLQALAASNPQLLGGSADLAGSNGSLIAEGGDVSAQDKSKRNLHFGIREHAMAAVCNGLVLHGGVQPYCATFLTFHDYMRPSVRLAALMGLPVVYVYTHDSIFLGEDGPTHQPIEHLMAMRAMPNLWVVRPADANETAEAWALALTRRDGPTALCLTRQDLPVLDRTGATGGVAQGAYVLAEGEDVVLVATGSEVELALRSREALAGLDIRARVVSMPCWEAFQAQPRTVRDAVLPPARPTVSIEAGVTFGWERWADASVGIDRFGASAPAEVLAEKLGLTVANVVATAKRALARA